MMETKEVVDKALWWLKFLGGFFLIPGLAWGLFYYPGVVFALGLIGVFVCVGLWFASINGRGW